MSTDSTARLYLAIEDGSVDWKDNLEEKYSRNGYVEDICRAINYDDQDEYFCGICLFEAEWGCEEICPEELMEKIVMAREELSKYVNNPYEFKLTLSAEYF